MGDAVSFAGLISSIIVFGILFGNTERQIRRKKALRPFYGAAFWLAAIALLLVPVAGIYEVCTSANTFERVICGLISLFTILLILLCVALRRRQAPDQEKASGDAGMLHYLRQLRHNAPQDLQLATFATELKEKAYADVKRSTSFWDSMMQD